MFHWLMDGLGKYAEHCVKIRLSFIKKLIIIMFLKKEDFG